tara:strand:- start:234 stop:1124 length:891 start_codon:yes stop_codon:yes gene_type:complete
MRRQRKSILKPSKAVSKNRHSKPGVFFGRKMAQPFFSNEQILSKRYEKVRPFILTCDKRLDSFEKFVKSYNSISHCLLQPVLIMDDTTVSGSDRKRYHDLVIKLNPYVVIKQPQYSSNELREWDPINFNLNKSKHNYLNVQKFMIKDFPDWALKYSDGPVLFLEDDILLSSYFPSGISEALKHIDINADFITMYANSRYKKYNRYKSYKFMHPINGNDYYGNLCILFSRKVISSLANNKEEVKSMSSAFDTRWGTYMQKRFYRMYETKIHYASHQPGYSSLDEGVWKDYRGEFFIK